MARSEKESEMTEKLVETWEINNRVNLMLLDGLSQEALETSLSSRGGRTVGQQLAHVLTVRRSKLEKANKALVAGLPEVTRDDGHDKAALVSGFEKTGEAISELIRESAEKDGAVKGFRRGIVALVGYFIAHDAHHRGHLLLTLKQAKVKIPSNLKMEIWAWNKI
jgi:uncharacterized damage-inducible protein DinB